MTFTDFSPRITAALDAIGAPYRLERHEAALTPDAIAALTPRFGFIGEEMKNLLLTDPKSRRFFLIVTLARKRMDFEKLTELLAEPKLKFASPERVAEVAHAVPGCVSPFGFSDEIPILVDEEIFSAEKLLFSPGTPEATLECASADLRRVLENEPNPVRFATL